MSDVPLFRVWHKTSKEFIQANLRPNGDVEQLKYIDVEYQYHTKSELVCYIIDNVEVCRFTGLFDNKNKPIYEGDIVRVISSQEFIFNVKIEFNFSSFGYWLYGDWEYITDNHTAEIQNIVGNVFENPELLKDTNG